MHQVDNEPKQVLKIDLLRLKNSLEGAGRVGRG